MAKTLHDVLRKIFVRGIRNFLLNETFVIYISFFALHAVCNNNLLSHLVLYTYLNNKSHFGEADFNRHIAIWKGRLIKGVGISHTVGRRLSFTFWNPNVSSSFSSLALLVVSFRRWADRSLFQQPCRSE